MCIHYSTRKLIGIADGSADLANARPNISAINQLDIIKIYTVNRETFNSSKFSRIAESTKI